MRHITTLCLFIAFGASACSSDLSHTAAFDPDSPAVRQARAELTGRILLEGESDSSGVDVQIQNQERTYQVTSAKDGSVALTGVVPGAYHINISTRYFEPADMNIEVPLDSEVQLGTIVLKPLKAAVVGKATLETLDQGNTVTSGGVELTLQKTGSIRADTEGAPAQFAAAAAKPATDAVKYQTVSLSNGAYTISGVAAGQYILIGSTAEVSAITLSIVKVTGDGTVTVDDAILRPLTGFFTIQGSADGLPNSTFTQVPDLSLNMIAFNAVEMAIGSSSTGAEAGCVLGARETFSATPPVKPNFLTEGSNTICVRFFDESGNGTGMIRQSILLDTTAPLGALDVDHGNATSNNAAGQVFLTIDAADALTGVKSMKVANLAASGTCSAALASVSQESFSPIKSWPLDNAGAGLSGTRWVCAALGDGAGNWSAPVSDAIQYDTLAPTGTGISINAGAAVTNSLQVTLSLAASGATEMMLGNDGSFAGSNWEPFRANLAWTLSNVQGSRSVSVLFRDAAGNTSAVASDTIDLDTVAPTAPAIAINGGAAYASVTAVTLTLSALGQTKMQISSDGLFDAEPIVAFASPQTAYLAGGDGPKNIFVRFFDDAGNVSAAAAAGIALDQSPPTSTGILIDGGATFNASAAGSVSLTLQATDFGSGVGEMKIASLGADVSCVNAVAGATAESFAASKAWTVDNAGPDVSGTRWVCAAFRDAAGNWSAPVSDAIQYDTMAPTGTGVSINAGAAGTNSLQVALTLSASGATEMMLGNDGSFAASSWEPFRASVSWTLANLQGTRTVSALFRDAAGNQTAVAADSIDLDTIPPTGGIAINGGAGVTNATTASLQLSAAGAAEMILSNDGTFDTESWETFSSSKPNWPLGNYDGLQFVYARYRDTAGNESATYFATITVDRVKPAGTLRIDGGAAWSSEPAGDVTLTLAAGDDRTGVSVMRVANKVTTCDADLAAVSTENFVTVKAWVLDNPGADFGTSRTVCAAFGDGAGNWSDPIETAIGFDPEQPVVYNGGITINGGAAFAQSSQVVLALAATGATEMQIANNGSFTGAQWEPYRYESVWFLLAGEGSRTVWARFRDAAGNTTISYSGTIQVDITPPGSPSVVIDGGAAYTNSASVTLALSASGASEMQISDDGFFDTEAIAGYVTSVGWTLGGADGAKVIAVRFLDDAGNSVVATAAIVLDTQPFGPSLTFALQGTDMPSVAGRTKNQVVNAIFAGLVSEAVEMQISNDADFIGAPWQPTSATTSWALLPGEGLKTVYARVRNAAGNTSNLLSATIVLDQSGPDSPGLAVSDVDGDGWAVDTGRVELRWTQPNEAVQFELQRYILGVDAVFTPITNPTGATSTYVDFVTGTTGLVHQYRVRAFDSLGNPSPWSIIAVAYPFEPVQGIYWVKTDAGYRYQFPVNRGTFSLRPALQYVDANGQGSLALAENVTDWLAVLDPSWYNLNLAVKTSNNDNSLVYNSNIPIFGNEYNILEAANVGNEDKVGLAVDKNGATHMFYGGQYFTTHYATNASGAWTIESIGTGNIYEPDMVIDKNGKVHVVFLDYFGGNQTVAYMTNKSGSWVRTDLASGGSWSYYQPALAVADDGTVHIVYSYNFASLIYGTNPEAWSPSVIDSAGTTPSSIQVDGAGTVHILSQGSGQTLRYGVNSGSGWTFTTVEGSSDSGNMVIDRQGNIHTAYHNNSDSKVHYAVYSGGVWNIEALADAAWEPSLTLDSAGVPHIAYSTGTSLRIADKSTGSWSYQTLESNPNGYRPPTLRASRSGNLSLGYIDLGIHSVKVRRLVSSSSTVSQVGALGDGGTYPAMLTAPGNALQIAYGAGALAYGNNITGTWSKDVLDPGINPARIVMAPYGNATEIAYREGTNIRYVDNIGGAWQAPAVLTNYAGALVGNSKGGVGLAVGATGQAHIVFARNGGSYVGLGYLTNPGGVWDPLQNIYNSTIGYPKEIAAQMGPDGNIRIAVSGWAADNRYSLSFATLNPTLPSWMALSAVNVDPGNADEVALAVDAQGKNHILYIGAFTAYSATDDVQTGVVRYATDKSGAWVVTTIDSASAYIHPRIALDASGKVYATYNDTLNNNRLKYASTLSGSWRSVNLDPSGTLGPSSLLVDETGAPRLAFPRAAENTVLLLEDFAGFIPAASILRSSPY